MTTLDKIWCLAPSVEKIVAETFDITFYFFGSNEPYTMFEFREGSDICKAFSLAWDWLENGTYVRQECNIYDKPECNIYDELTMLLRKQ